MTRYALFVNKTRKKIGIYEDPVINIDIKDYDETVKRYNEHYCYSTNLKALTEYGNALKESWIAKAEYELSLIKQIDVKVLPHEKMKQYQG